MRLLLTNDDGISAPGLRTLAARLSGEGHRLRVIAPMRERSGSAASLGTVADGAVFRGRLEPSEAFEARAVDAPPALAVRAACKGIWGEPPDLVVSGINPGHNTGRLVLHSGTVGAAITALSLNRPAIAVSCGNLPGSRFDTAAEICAAAVRAMHKAGLPPIALNINVPDLDLAEVKGVRETCLGYRALNDLEFTAYEDGLRIKRVHNTEGLDPESDAAAVVSGFVSVTRLPGPWETSLEAKTVVRHLEMELSARITQVP